MPVIHDPNFIPKMFKDKKAVITIGGKPPENPMQGAADMCEAGIRAALESTEPLEERLARFEASTILVKKE